MAGKNTRKNKGPIGRKQHRTLRNKRQMRGGANVGSNGNKITLKTWKDIRDNADATSWETAMFNFKSRAKRYALEANVKYLAEVLTQANKDIKTLSNKYLSIRDELGGLSDEFRNLQRMLGIKN